MAAYARAQYRYAERSDADFRQAPAPERRAHVTVVPGTRQGTEARSLESVVKIAIVVMAIVACVCVARIALSSAATSTLIEADNIQSDIADARAEGTELEVSKTALSSPTTLKAKAADLGMVQATDIETIVLDADVVVTDAAGSLSLSGSIEAVAQP